MQQFKIFNIPILFDRDEINKVILLNKNKKGNVNTINANILVNAFKNKDYFNVLSKSTFNICDGSLVSLMIGLLYKKQINSYPGPDFFIDKIIERKYTHTFLGSTKENLKCLKSELSKIDISINKSLFLELPYTNVEDFNYEEISKKVNQFNSDFIWVSLGAPKQEFFSYNLLKYIDKGLIVSVGAAFDFYSGHSEVSRCPLFLRRLKLEWLYRLFKEPKKTFSRLINELIYMPIIFMKELLNK